MRMLLGSGAILICLVFSFHDTRAESLYPIAPLPERFSEVEACAEAGDAVCQFFLGDIYYRRVNDYIRAPEGEPGEVQAYDPAKAYKWYLAAARQRHQRAMEEVADLLCGFPYHTVGVDQDPETAMVWALVSTNLQTDRYVFGAAWRRCAKHEPNIDFDRVFKRAIDLFVELNGYVPANHLD